METYLCKVCTFDWRTELDMDNNHIFPRCVLVSITLLLITGGDPDRMARDSTVCEWDFLSAQWPSLPYWGWCLILSFWSRNPVDPCLSGICALEVCSALPTRRSFPCGVGGSTETSVCRLPVWMGMAVLDLPCRSCEPLPRRC